MNTAKTRAFVYTRRSQDRVDRQVLSIDGQLDALKKLAIDNDIEPIFLPPEERTAHKPGRPIFNDMMTRIENGEARYILTWNVNRLSRNPVDAGRVIYAFDTGHLLAILTPGRRYTDVKEDLLLLSVELSMSKLTSDDIRAGVKRGYSIKYQLGEYPAYAPVGYVNSGIGKKRNIYPDPEKAPLITIIFESAATGFYTLDTLHKFTQSIGLLSRNGNILSKSTLYDLMRNRLYAGVFLHGGEWHQGSYEPLISMDIFDQAQIGLGFRKRNGIGKRALNHPYKKLLSCGNCGCSITAETKTKILADKSTAQYSYYRCTKRNKKLNCTEKAITSTDLVQQLRSCLEPFVLSQADGRRIIQILEDYQTELTNNRNTMLPVWKKDLVSLRKKISGLIEMRAAGEIDAGEFERHSLILREQERRILELVAESETTATAWLELAREFFSASNRLTDSFDNATAEERIKLLNYVGSNWQLNSKKAVFKPRKPYDLLLNQRNDDFWRARPVSNRRSPP